MNNSDVPGLPTYLSNFSSYISFPTEEHIPTLPKMDKPSSPGETTVSNGTSKVEQLATVGYTCLDKIEKPEHSMCVCVLNIKIAFELQSDKFIINQFS